MKIEIQKAFGDFLNRNNQEIEYEINEFDAHLKGFGFSVCFWHEIFM